ncbi:hypothetical protein [Limnobaculum zhutongyuii]|nr:hypothetical protein [Limnobaculum zhutongyuii]
MAKGNHQTYSTRQDQHGRESVSVTTAKAEENKRAVVNVDDKRVIPVVFCRG